MKKLLKTTLVILGLIFIFIISFIVWGSTPAKPMPDALSALTSDSSVSVKEGNLLIFKPEGYAPKTGYIFYPGGRVDYRAYSPYARKLAEGGYLVIIPKMPLNLAVFGYKEADLIIGAHPEIKAWVIGGHSLGGAMAAHYLAENPDKIKGLIFLAAYPAKTDDLTNYPGEVLSISGSLDGLATPEKIKASAKLLPLPTKWVEIEGGIHAYFGWYGQQAGDNSTSLPRGEQNNIVLNETLLLLDRINDSIIK